MSGQQPPRHGLGGWSSVPVPTAGAQKGRGIPGSTAPGAPTTFHAPEKPKEIGVVQLTNEFLTAMPEPGMQQIARHDSVRYPPGTALGDTITINGTSVPNGMVMVLTDVTFFVTVPSPGLGGAEIRVTAASLAGLLRFSVLFNNNTPLQLDGSFLSPLAGTTRNLSVRSGWPFTERPFGVQRAPAFAIYAKGGQNVTIQAIVDVLPDFPITTVGAEMGGFTLSQMNFSRLFKGV